MTYTVSWHDKNSVLIVDVEHSIDLDELSELNHDIQSMMTPCDRVHIIFRTRTLKHVPTNILKIKQHTPFLDRAEMGTIVMVGANPLVKYLASTVSAFSKVNMRTVNQFDEAIHLLERLEQA